MVPLNYAEDLASLEIRLPECDLFSLVHPVNRVNPV